jgi:hypothetical protein
VSADDLARLDSMLDQILALHDPIERVDALHQVMSLIASEPDLACRTIMQYMFARFLEERCRELEPTLRAICAERGLDFDDPELQAELSQPCGFEEFRRRLDDLAARKGRKGNT